MFPFLLKRNMLRVRVHLFASEDGYSGPGNPAQGGRPTYSGVQGCGVWQ